MTINLYALDSSPSAFNLKTVGAFLYYSDFTQALFSCLTGLRNATTVLYCPDGHFSADHPSVE